MKPFSYNLIFFDTEFSTMDPYKGEILSIGMVDMAGNELYLEIEQDCEINQWTQENILPMLSGEKISKTAAAEKIRQFAGGKKNYLISYVTMYDSSYFYKLMGVNDEKINKSLPFEWIIIDFASILFANGYNPAVLAGDEQKEMLARLNINSSGYRRHHALDDAKLLKDVYLRMFS